MAGFDRRVTVHVEAEGTRNQQGRYEPGPVTDYEVWAAISDGGESDTNTVGGIITLARAVFALRWNKLFLDTPPSRLQITDHSNGLTYRIQTVSDFQVRRRLIHMSGVVRIE